MEISTKMLLAGIACCLAGLGWVEAANIAVYSLDEENPQNSYVVLDSAGNPLPVGMGYIAVGTFRTLGEEAVITAGNRSDWPTIINDFDQFGTAGNIKNFAGIVTHDASEAVLDNSALLGKPIYVVIGNAPNGLGPSELLLVYKSAEVFPLDNPFSEARVDLTSGNSENFLVGGLAEETITLTGTTLEQFGMLSTIKMSGELGFPIRPFVIIELNVQFEGGTIDIAWNSRPNATYKVEFSEDLHQWTEIASGLVSGGSVTAFIDRNVPPNTTRRFYRISEE